LRSTDNRTLDRDRPENRARTRGLYDPSLERDSCGVGFVANLKGHKSHQIIEHGLECLLNLTHRGAVGADPEAGDGAGLLAQIPHRLFAEECSKLGIELPAPGQYAVGHIFMPQDESRRRHVKEVIEGAIEAEGHVMLGFDAEERLIQKLPHNFAAKVVWGSRYPHHDTTSAWDAIQALAQAHVAEATIARMLGGNAAEQFGIKLAQKVGAPSSRSDLD